MYVDTEGVERKLGNWRKFETELQLFNQFLRGKVNPQSKTLIKGNSNNQGYLLIVRRKGKIDCVKSWC